MARKKWTSWVLLLVLQLLSTTGAWGQDYHPYAVNDEFEPFAGPELGTYGGAPRPKHGFYFNAEYVDWWITSPDPAVIGQAGLTALVFDTNIGFTDQNNSLTTGGWEADNTSGSQLEVGFRNEEGNGWMVRGFKLHDASQTMFGSDVDVVFVDPPHGPNSKGYLDRFFDLEIAGYVRDTTFPIGDGFHDDIDRDSFFGRNGQDTNADGTPNLFAGVPDDYDDAVRARVTFDELRARNRSQLWGIEWMRTLSLPTRGLFFERISKRGWTWEGGAGVRFMQLNSDYFVNAYGGFLADSNWNTEAKNNIVGPQLMVRGNRQVGRFNVILESRYFGGFNFQTVRQRGVLGSALDQNDTFLVDQMSGGYSFNNYFDASEYSPVVELKAGAGYQITKALRVHAAWQGFWADGIARGANMVEYTLPRMGINDANNREDVFVHGINVGLEINR